VQTAPRVHHVPPRLQVRHCEHPLLSIIAKWNVTRAMSKCGFQQEGCKDYKLAICSSDTSKRASGGYTGNKLVQSFICPEQHDVCMQSPHIRLAIWRLAIRKLKVKAIAFRSMRGPIFDDFHHKIPLLEGRTPAPLCLHHLIARLKVECYSTAIGAVDVQPDLPVAPTSACKAQGHDV
jgi:hypothetical protein